MYFTALKVFLLFLFSASSLAAPASQNTDATASATDNAPAQPASTVCGDIVNSSDTPVFNASVIHECLISVPFNAAVASRLINYLNYTLHFQSTLAYLRTPPPSYQQPPVDLIGGLAQIQQQINSGAYHNQYAFEKDLQQLLYAAHDGHLNLVLGVTAAFTFGSFYDLVSASEDGIQPPKVYVQTDLMDTGFTPSPLKTINGQDVVEFLTQFAAAQSAGTLEPNADWNQLFASPAADIQSYIAIWTGGATLYPGDTLTITFENGTQSSSQWQGLYNTPGPTGPLETGGDFYNFFVLNFYPASFQLNNGDGNFTSPTNDTSDSSSTTSSNSTSTIPSASPSVVSWGDFGYIGYPTAQMSQTDLSPTGGGFLTGYFLKDTSLGVISIPSFQEVGDAIGTFSSFIGDFLAKAKKAGMKKILIDVQQNGGGDTFLAIDAFRQFFPDNSPFAGSRMRSHPEADILGDTITQYWNSINNDEDDYFDLLPDEFLSSPRINANTGQNFSSWREFSNGYTANSDHFSTTQQYNLSSRDFDIEASGGLVPYGYADNPVTAPQQYAANDIMILSDGICSSACALFMEMMISNGNDQSGSVRTVAVGGRPGPGPMQAPAGTRGAAMYSTVILDSQIRYVNASNATAGALLPNRTIDTHLTHVGLNLRDQIRENETTPLQFVYEPADCRIYFTLKNVYNLGQLWRDAANALFNNNTMCVPGSTGRPEAPAPAQEQNTHISGYIMSGLEPDQNADPGDLFEPTISGIQDTVKPPTTPSLRSCSSKQECDPTHICRVVKQCIKGKPVNEHKCLPRCKIINSARDSCYGATNCFPLGKPVKEHGFWQTQGYCLPSDSKRQQKCETRHRHNPLGIPDPYNGGAVDKAKRYNGVVGSLPFSVANPYE
ncbi:hypothetical protein EV356DRAFT_472116 [Viridothelium virens]|uniref:Uncharacterized protein n=1 Tax=Viridothelium virens TaxID=1048519 RepID=A0A6A6GZT4_VIRVR|nr:hypothetical protein EV356DRAFT_472116 [Viridothelium virens]